MRLFEDGETFYDLIETAAAETGLSTAQIEKDYFVSILLKELSERLPDLLFKGGTSLSKCHRAISRFSEDIDLTLREHHQGRRARHKVKHAMFDACESLGLKILNADDVESGRDFNVYLIEYPLNYRDGGLTPTIRAETAFMLKPYPDETKLATSIIYDFLKERGGKSFIASYPELEPFPIRVQTLERTFVDKVFALCDYAISGKIARNSRHIYDLYCLWPIINLGDGLKDLAKEVRKDRKENGHSPSSQDGVDVEAKLSEILAGGIYRGDYETITKAMVHQGKYVPYDEAATVLRKIMEEGIFKANP